MNVPLVNHTDFLHGHNGSRHFGLVFFVFFLFFLFLEIQHYYFICVDGIKTEGRI